MVHYPTCSTLRRLRRDEVPGYNTIFWTGRIPPLGYGSGLRCSLAPSPPPMALGGVGGQRVEALLCAAWPQCLIGIFFTCDFASADFGKVRRSTPSASLALILSFSTSVGSRMVRSNAPKLRSQT